VAAGGGGIEREGQVGFERMGGVRRKRGLERKTVGERVGVI